MGLVSAGNGNFKRENVASLYINLDKKLCIYQCQKGNCTTPFYQNSYYSIKVYYGQGRFLLQIGNTCKLTLWCRTMKPCFKTGGDNEQEHIGPKQTVIDKFTCIKANITYFTRHGKQSRATFIGCFVSSVNTFISRNLPSIYWEYL